VAKFAIVAFIVFGAWWVKDYLAGGYKAVKLTQSGKGEGKPPKMAGAA
jgi:hypothetical protein